MKPIQPCTLLELVQTVDRYTKNEQETVAAVAYLINSGKVRLCGNFAGAKIDLSSPPAIGQDTTPSSSSRRAAYTVVQRSNNQAVERMRRMPTG